MNNIKFIVDDKKIDVNRFLELVQQVWAGEYHEEWTKEALDKTINITAWDEEKIIGCIRILTDGYYFGTITEILVIPNYRGKGIGTRLMELAWEASPTSLFFGSQQGNEIFFDKAGYEKSMQSYQKRKPRRI
jgi:ribosomal protein S18 acetylase RimI-like enzyme